MDISINIISYTFFSIVQFATICIFYKKSLSTPPKKIGYLLSLGLLRAVLSTIVYVKADNVMINFAITIVFVFLILFLFPFKLRNVSLGFYVIFILSSTESIVVYVLSTFLKILPDYVRDTYIINILGTFLSIAFAMAVFILFCGMMKTIYKNILDVKFYVFFSFLPLASAIIHTSIDNINRYVNSEQIPTVYGCLSFSLLLLLNIAFVAILASNIDFFVYRVEKGQMQLLLQSMEESQKNEIKHQMKERQIAHDFQNILRSFQASSYNPDSMKSTTEKYLSEFGKYMDEKFTYIKPLDSILSSKKKKAEDQGVTVHISSPILVEQNINYIDLAIIIGIAFDNAIEAKYSEDYIIDVQFSTRNNVFIMAIKNAYINPILKDENDIIVSSKKDGRGLGLKGIESLVNRNNGSFHIGMDDNVFSLIVMLYESTHS